MDQAQGETPCLLITDVPINQATGLWHVVTIECAEART